MRTFLIPVFLAALFLAGCESMPGRIRERFSAVPPKTRVIAGDKMTVYHAAQMAFKRLDFALARSSPGEIEAVGRIHSSVTMADARQLVARLKLGEMGPEQTEVQLFLTEQVEGQSLGGTSRVPLRDHGFFESYFATLQQVLQEEAAAIQAKKQ